jgi:glutathionyl-hydroquinone reductase
MDRDRLHFLLRRLHSLAGIVPIGPLLDFTQPHDRGRFG